MKQRKWNNRLMTILILALSLTFCSKKETDKKIDKIKPINKEIASNNENIAADFSLINMDGEEVKLSDFKGKVVLLNFWGTWCPPCRAEIPGFIKMYEENKSRGLEIIGITLSSGSIADIRKFVTGNKMNYTVLTGDEAYLHTLAKSYENIRSIPTSFLIDRDGIIREKWVGQLREETFLNKANKFF